MDDRVYTTDNVVDEIAWRTGKCVTRHAVWKQRKRHGYGFRIGGRIYFSASEVATICARVGNGHGGRTRTSGAAPDRTATYDSIELQDEIYKRTGRHVNLAWLAHRFAPSAGYRWSYGDLVRICAQCA